MNDPAFLAALAAALIGPLLAYIAASRKLSGRIDTSEASSLWEESSAIRKDYRDRLAESEGRIARLESRLGEMERRNTSLSEDNATLARKNAEQERTIKALEARVEKLEAENVRLRQRIAEAT